MKASELVSELVQTISKYKERNDSNDVSRNSDGVA